MPGGPIYLLIYAFVFIVLLVILLHVAGIAALVALGTASWS